MSNVITNRMVINHKITEKEKRDNLGYRGIYFWRGCNSIAEYATKKEGNQPSFFVGPEIEVLPVEDPIQIPGSQLHTFFLRLPVG